MSDLIPPFEGAVLKPEYEKLYLDWDERYGGGNCACHINPPCASCTDEGNPICLNETPEAWEDGSLSEGF